MKPPIALTVAGSDSGGGAGIQADLKTFAALSCHGVCAVTAITAQNTLGVEAIQEVSIPVLRSQIRAVFSDLAPQAMKTGMLSSSSVISAVAEEVEGKGVPLVVDPVMVAKGGAKLLQEEAVATLRARLLPLAAVVTPNLPEAEILTSSAIRTPADMEEAGRRLVQMGCRAAVVKGGHASGPADDLLFDGERLIWLRAERWPTANTHGSGCTFSAAIAAHLARGLDTVEAVTAAKTFITQAIRFSLEVGGGHGPVNPMFATWRPRGD